MWGHNIQKLMHHQDKQELVRESRRDIELYSFLAREMILLDTIEKLLYLAIKH